MTVPLALRLPKICDGLAPPISLSATEFAEGWMKVVVAPAWMLKLLQLRNAAWLTVKLSCAPLVWAVAVPSLTVIPVGLASSFKLQQAAKNNMARPGHFRLAAARARWNCWDERLFFILQSELDSDAEISPRLSGVGCGRVV